MMKEAAKVVHQEAKQLHVPKPLIFGVTVLTSLAKPDLKELGTPQNPLQQVQRLSRLAKKAGLDGVVASGNEIRAVREVCGKRFLVMTPGIRTGTVFSQEDQKRIMTPKRALNLGANYLVVGRAVLDAKNRVRAAKELPRTAIGCENRDEKDG
jgi:orotidine-5'-phosphate decarboxylase